MSTTTQIQGEVQSSKTGHPHVLSRAAKRILSFFLKHVDRHDCNLLARTIAVKGEAVDPLDQALREQQLPFLSWLLNNAIPNKPLRSLAEAVQLRQRWLDEEVNQSLADGIQQVVVLYSGYDSRGFILSKDDVNWIDVDFPSVHKKKQNAYLSLLSNSEEVPHVSFEECDFRYQQLQRVLEMHKYDKNKRTIFILEDVVSHLKPDQVCQLFLQISEVAIPGSRVYFDFVHKEFVDDMKAQRKMQRRLGRGYNFQSGLVPSFGSIRTYFKALGFQPFEMKGGKDLVEVSHSPNIGTPYDLLSHYGFAGVQKTSMMSPRSSPSDSPPHTPRDNDLGRHATLNLSLSKFGYIDDI
eukprot:TRINITY_DN6814_c0_g1_i11.p1 TRINITY_DN6814_c0_g1~~TRINITY_DN6814_c0_g1_i11.p1  ORF type:complete len:352 (-),score=37.81 TRINITY_DN6814_c0_g1_i11:1508-2563(-)